MDAAEQVLQHYESIRAEQEDFYKDLHQNPEPSHQERRTAAGSMVFLRHGAVAPAAVDFDADAVGAGKDRAATDGDAA